MQEKKMTLASRPACLWWNVCFMFRRLPGTPISSSCKYLEEKQVLPKLYLFHDNNVTNLAMIIFRWVMDRWKPELTAHSPSMHFSSEVVQLQWNARSTKAAGKKCEL